MKKPAQAQAEELNPRSRPPNLKRHRAVQVNFRVSTKWLQIVSTLSTSEGRSVSALMRELLTLGLAEYVSIYYRTPQLVRMQQLKTITKRLQEKEAQLRDRTAHGQSV